MLASMKELQTFPDGSVPEKVITKEICILTGVNANLPQKDASYPPFSLRVVQISPYSLCGLRRRGDERPMKKNMKLLSDAGFQIEKIVGITLTVPFL